MTGNKRFISLKLKMTIVIALICILTGFLAVMSVNRISADIVDKEYEDRSMFISEAVAKTLDPQEVREVRDSILRIYDANTDRVVTSSEWGSDEWNDYISLYDDITEMPLYKKLQDTIRLYQDIFGVDCIYLSYYKLDARHSLYLIDGAYGEDNCPPGCVDSFDDGIWPDNKQLTIPPGITNTDAYGWLVTGGYAVTDGEEVIAYLCTDISMDEVKEKERSYIRTVLLAMLALTLFTLVIALWYVSRSVIRPVQMLTDTARNYCSENNDAIHHNFESLYIQTHDEISRLLFSMQQMERDMNSNIENLIDTKYKLNETAMKAREMTKAAMKDELTCVGSKAAYVKMVAKIEDELKEKKDIVFGIIMVDLNFLKKTNDTYGHDKGNEAIKAVCHMVCRIFAHSPVYRIGGDEFIVILRNHDFEERESLLAELKNDLKEAQENESLEPWERVSAAIGLAIYDSNIDSGVESVFKRADSEMYEDKKQMKAVRND